MLGSAAQAQWQDTSYTLKGGWNAIYLSGDATYAPIENVFPNSGATASIQEVWRWNAKETEVQFTQSPLIPSAGTPDWTVWVRGGGDTLRLTGQDAYLVKCAGTTADSYVVTLRQSPLPPRNTWVRNGANLLGFPTRKNGAFPTFSSYFATFPAAIAASTRIYRYVGGELGAGNPLQLFSTASERVDRTQAYWFSAEVVGDFYAPFEVSLSKNEGLSFGRTGALVTARIRNRTSAAMTLTFTPVVSLNAPASQPGITGPVPLTRRTFDPGTQNWVEEPVTAAFTQAVGPQSTLELTFGINRVAMTGPADSFYASLLRLTDSGNLVEMDLPVTASKATLAGLWVGDVSVTHVSNRVTNPARAAATVDLTQGSVNQGRVTAITLSGSGGYGYDTPPVVTLDPPLSGTQAQASAIVANGSVTGFTITHAGSGYAVASPKVTIADPPPLTGTTTPRPMALRTLLHVADNGTASLLSQVFIGRIAAGQSNAVGVCTHEALLKQDAKASAQRLTAAHLPLDRVETAGSGAVAVPGSLTRTITIAYNDPTHPLVHQYHPDHDNKNARLQPVGNGVESQTVTRTCTFTFTPEPPDPDTISSGWGSTIIGGTYQEVITGLHKLPLQLNGTFELRRASEDGTLHTVN